MKNIQCTSQLPHTLKKISNLLENKPSFKISSVTFSMKSRQSSSSSLQKNTSASEPSHGGEVTQEHPHHHYRDCCPRVQEYYKQTCFLMFKKENIEVRKLSPNGVKFHLCGTFITAKRQRGPLREAGRDAYRALLIILCSSWEIC